MHIPFHTIWRSTLYEEHGAREQAWQALDELFEFWPHLVACSVIILCAAYTIWSGGGEYAFEAMAVAVIHLAIRGIGGRMYRRRAANSDLARWTRIFSASALFSGIGWGISLALLLINAPLDSRYLVLTVACVIMQSANARAHMAPRPLIGQTSLFIILVSAASIYNGDWIIAPASLLFLAFQIGHMRNLIRLRLRQLTAEVEKDDALAQLEMTNKDLLIANETLRMHALTDGQTGLPNRRAFDMHFSTQHMARRKKTASLSMILFDIDHFKHFNDTYGHQAGDACLTAVGEALRRITLREHELIARYGGEEFVMVLPETSEAEAVAMAEQLRQTIANIGLECDQGQNGITISLGVVALGPGSDAGEDQLINMADQALYLAKQKGRNRVEVYRECAKQKTDQISPSRPRSSKSVKVEY